MDSRDAVIKIHNKYVELQMQLHKDQIKELAALIDAAEKRGFEMAGGKPDTPSGGKDEDA